MAREIAEWLDTCASPPAVIRCHSAILRSALLPLLDPDQFVLCDGLALAPGAVWAAAAKAVIVGELAAQEESLRKARVLYGASDGSVHPIHGHGAYAWITEAGQYEIGRAPRSILLAELTGIIQFAKSVPVDTFARAVLFVDSLRAIRTIQHGGPALWRLNDQEGMLRTVSMVRGGRLELVWVRGHSGHVLNDVADRLALLRHRAAWIGLSAGELEASADRIVSTEKENLRGADRSEAYDQAIKDWEHLTLHYGGTWSHASHRPAA